MIISENKIGRSINRIDKKAKPFLPIPAVTCSIFLPVKTAGRKDLSEFLYQIFLDLNILIGNKICQPGFSMHIFDLRRMIFHITAGIKNYLFNRFSVFFNGLY